VSVTLPPLSIMVEGVLGGTAYISYVNSGQAPLTIPIGDSATEKNFFTPGEASLGQPTVFAPGVHRGAIRIPVSQPITWVVQHGSAPEMRIDISPTTPELPAIRPEGECIQEATAGGFAAVIGYLNPNEFTIVLPAGPLNRFSPGQANLGQPTLFQPGLRRGVSVVPLSEEIVWTVVRESTRITSSTGICLCPLTANSDAKNKINDLSLQLGEIAFQVSEELEQANAARLQNAPRKNRERSLERAKRAKERAANFVVEMKQLTARLPTESLSCPNLPNDCSRVDDSRFLQPMRYSVAELTAWIKRMTGRTMYLKTGSTEGTAEKLSEALRIGADLAREIQKVPEIRVECKRGGREVSTLQAQPTSRRSSKQKPRRARPDTELGN